MTISKRLEKHLRCEVDFGEFYLLDVNADKTCALLPGRDGHAALAIDDMSGAHQQGIGHVLPVGGAHVRIALLQGLLHDGHSARRMGGSHGSAVHALLSRRCSPWI